VRPKRDRIGRGGWCTVAGFMRPNDLRMTCGARRERQTSPGPGRGAHPQENLRPRPGSVHAPVR